MAGKYILKGSGLEYINNFKTVLGAKNYARRRSMMEFSIWLDFQCVYSEVSEKI